MSSPAVSPPERSRAGDPARLRRTFGAFATGVTVVTVGGDAPRGMTANSFTSVSLAPPLVLVCVGKDAVMHRTLAHSRTFSVSVLGAGQEDVARHFADRSRPMGAGQFEAFGRLEGLACDAPLVPGAAAYFECEKWREYDGGDHTIYLGEVLREEDLPDRGALLFHRGCLRGLATRAPEAAA
ncbi:flavin reductase family protein [Streptomyces sp. CNQ085]|uniref:flavin reductase family protein n=1 Tax=Streptomyces sp. CNQ085 TaxID=2886944 RepID=UPI001F50F7E8|nr:flavin reductase family protein [Streptomyces sp. CNQ085]MCI0383196.1 flavin reductase family protein [Streptomyces sp. CNQ085]